MIEVKELTKIYPTKERDFIALNGVSLKFEPGEFIAVLGESGSGKTTFLNMISGVDVKTKGKILFNELDVDKFNDSKWREIRNQEIGFIFQRFNLIDHLTVMENVVLPLILTGSDNNIARIIAKRLLKEVELEGIEDKLASELSGGQRQRVAIARTIIINPTIILADEPTGALDSSTAIEIMKLLQKFAPGRIIIMVTHDEDLAYKNATRVVRLHDGDILSDEIIKEKNGKTRDSTNHLLSYETKVTRRLKKRLLRQFPEIEESLIVGKKCMVPLERKYISNNPVFTRKIARENYKQKLKINRRILWSFIISISLLLLVNIVMKNISAYNFNLFEVNNNYQQFVVTDYENMSDTLSALKANNDIDEAAVFYEHRVQDLYLVKGTSLYEITSSTQAINKGVFSPKMVTLPSKESNYYLSDQILVGRYPKNAGEIIVSSEFLLSRFLGVSLDSTQNDEELPLNNLSSLIGSKLFVCGETISSDVTVTEVVLEDECYDFVVAGILNSYYKGVNYTGNIFVQNTDFEDYIEDLRNDKNFTRVDEYYDTSLSFYLKDIDKEFNISVLEKELNATIENPQLGEYNETKTLEIMIRFINIAVFASLIIISGTIDINIVASSVDSRIKEIGIYSCIGVSKKSIRNMFVFETLEIAIRILIINSLIYVGIAFGFRFLYKSIVVDLTDFEPIFGVNEMFGYQISFAIYLILGAVAFLFISVLIPSFRAANMRAIDALRSE
jgi:ABC-type lipoprotein export system ATPase subunit/ABC-type antimicrobial peptide transport system permease subunit